MKQILHQQILLDKEDLRKLRTEGLNIVVPGGNTLTLGFHNNGFHKNGDAESAQVRADGRPIPEQILSGLASGPKTTKEIVATGLNAFSVYGALARLKNNGKIKKSPIGLGWVLSGANKNGK